MNISYQLTMKQEIPTVYGPLDYRIFRDQLVEIDHLLTASGSEERFIRRTIERGVQLNPKDLTHALRTVILLALVNESFRKLAFRIADSPLCQWFIGISTLAGETTPSKSTIERFEKYWSNDEISALILDLNQQTACPENSEKILNAELPLDFTKLYVDSTCIQANVHYPVDWLLLRDAVRTIIAGIKCMRNHGIIHRIPDPVSFLSEMNSLSMAMTAASRNRNAKKDQKKHFRAMKRILKTVVEHGKRYCELLKNEWHTTDLSQKQASLIIGRIESVVALVPDVIKLAHTRIITGIPAKNEDKILSLYEKDVHVIKRGKSSAELEFGNGFYLAEQGNGVIADWQFFKNKPDSDATILIKSIDRLNEQFKVTSVATDRGFNSLKNSRELNTLNVFDATCPRNPQSLKERITDPRFRFEQKRRGQTEGRIGLFKGCFLQPKLFRKGFESKEKKILWAIFTHNIWVTARVAIVNRTEREKQKTA